MTKVQQLRDQAAKAERLARGTLDNLTIERLMSMSAEYRHLADQLELTPELAFAIEPVTGRAN
jgi:hypothetical protein